MHQKWWLVCFFVGVALLVVLSITARADTSPLPAPVALSQAQRTYLPLISTGTTSGIQLPVEVLGPDGTTVAVQVPVTNGATVQSLWLQVHNLSYRDKASVQVNNGAWVPLNNTTVAVAEPGKRYGGIGGAFHTLKLTLTLPPGTVVNGSNTVRFRFNRTDGESIGFRVLALNFLDGAGTRVVAPSAFTQDDPQRWQLPRTTATDITAGAQLWRSGPIVERPGGRALKANCASCHAQDGRDLKYFNYSNRSIIERSKFHGLSQLQGEQIASYIRTLQVPNPGRPWNPPYQPGPGLDSKPVQEWAAGAGIDWVLDKDSDTQQYLPGNGTRRDALADGIHLKQLNLREIPIAFQLPDWNHWLPRVHPLDSMGDAFLNDPMYTRYTAIRQGLEGKRGMTKAQYIFGSMHRDFRSWADMFYGNFSGMINSSSTSALLKALGPSDKVSWTPEQVRNFYAVPVWSAVKQWEIMQEFDLEGYGKQFYGSNGETRQWFSDLHIFNVSPHIVFGIFARHVPVTGDGDGKLTNLYFANAWYELQILLNPGARNAVTGGFHTIDWQYQGILFGDLAQLINRGEPMRSTKFVLKAMQEHDNGYGPGGANEGGTSNPWWGWNLRDNLADMDRSLQDNWSEQPNPKPIVQNTYQIWMEQNGRYTADEWAKSSFGKLNDTYSVPGHDRVFKAEDMPFKIASLRSMYQLDEALLAGMADFGKLLWPNNNWDALKVAAPTPIAVPSGISATPGVEQVTVGWSPSAGATSYNVKRATAPDGIYLPVAYFVTGTSFSDRGLTAGQPYYYRVSANQHRYESTASPAVSVVPSTGLVARWTFNDANVGLDTSGNGNHAEAINAPSRSAGLLGHALQLDGARQFVSSRQSLHRWLGSTATLTTWVKTTAVGTSEITNSPGIVGTVRDGPAGGQDALWGVLDEAGRISARFGSSGAIVKSANPINDGQWHHVAIARDAATGSVTIYVDGAVVGSGTSSTGVLHRRVWNIGRIDANLRYWSGGLDDVRIYDKVLGAAEVQTIYTER